MHIEGIAVHTYEYRRKFQSCLVALAVCTSALTVGGCGSGRLNGPSSLPIGQMPTPPVPAGPCSPDTGCEAGTQPETVTRSGWTSYSHPWAPMSVVGQLEDGSIWFASLMGISHLDSQGKWSDEVHHIEPMSGVSVTAMGDDGALWFGTLEHGVIRIDASGSRTTYVRTEDAPVGDAPPCNTVYQIHEALDGAVWMATSYGIEGGSCTVSRLGPDGDWTHYWAEQHFDSAAVKSILATRNGDLWLATNLGLYRLQPGKGWLHYPSDPAQRGSDEVYAMLEGSDGTIWFGTLAGGVRSYSPQGSFSSHHADSGLVNDRVHVMLESRDGSLWFGTAEGLSRLDPSGDWASYGAPEPLPNPEVWAIYQSEDGSIWFGTQGGVGRLDPAGSWHAYASAGALAGLDVRSIYQSRDGALWFGTNAGVSRFDPDAGS